jgi:hypothetical protein
MYKVPFITVDDEEPDLVVSFPLGPAAETSLTLIRTPEFESLLDEDDRGVSVGSGNGEAMRRELLRALYWLDGQAVVVSDAAEYRLDLSAVDADEIVAAKSLLERMNFDGRFSIHAA